MFISEGSIKDHNYPFYDSNDINENHPKVVLVFLGGRGGIDQVEDGASYPHHNRYLK